MRAKTIDLIQDTAGKFVHFNANDMPDFVRDLVGSKKYKSTFGNRCESKIDHKEIFLPNLAAEYKSSEDKETNKEIPRQMSKQKQKVLHWTLWDSRISLSGTTSDVFKSRVDAAKSLSRTRS